ncbi:phosphatase PAP2 family protein [Actinopolymorpha alba]|uniref:phosphatase PAP2 family protein n=1 Tax=Actinopolymorpha alba TaxID=533267 RepID=UPI000366AD69|nr:phosphatase PAP2 family protein [Actinopolymorpha alba]
MSLTIDVPEISIQWYRDVTGFAQHAPLWLRDLAGWGTDAGLVLFAGLFVLVWWRSRRGEARGVVLALIAPPVTVAAYLLSETAKMFFHEQRPCRAIVGVTTIARCPALGDWSFPSNHATIVAASATSLVIAWRRIAAVVAPLAVLMAASRVFVGVHYPHDVAVGFLLGTAVAAALTAGLAPVLTPLVERLRPHPAAEVGADQDPDHRPACSADQV